MDNIIRMNIGSCTVIFPAELEHNKILKDNLFHIDKKVNDFLKAEKELKKDNEYIKSLYFDIEVKEYEKKHKEIEDKYNAEYNNLNYNLSPYYWKIFKDVDSFIKGQRIITNCLLVLEKREEDE